MIQYGTTFKDEYCEGYIQYRNMDIDKDMLASRFLYGKKLVKVLRYERVGKLFYEHLVLFNLVKKMTTEYLTTEPFISKVGNGIGGVTCFESSTLFKATVEYAALMLRALGGMVLKQW